MEGATGSERDGDEVEKDDTAGELPAPEAWMPRTKGKPVLVDRMAPLAVVPGSSFSLPAVEVRWSSFSTSSARLT